MPAKRILGAVIGGGASRRFGSDKAFALINGRPMLAHILDALRPQVAEIVICGRTWPDETTLADLRPERIGPLAGLEAALHYAAQHDFDAVLSVPVDTLPLPGDLVDRLQGAGPSVFGQQHLVGYWPTLCCAALTSHISMGGRDLKGWIGKSAARTVIEPQPIVNVNLPSDIVALQVTLRS
jgi:molybdenum cofactor guanylyltransferase